MWVSLLPPAGARRRRLQRAAPVCTRSVDTTMHENALNYTYLRVSAQSSDDP